MQELQSSSRTTCRPQARGDGEDDERSRDTSLRRIFNAVLNDCASIRSVLSADEENDTCSPKESFLCILVRNALCITRRDLIVKYVLSNFRRLRMNSDGTICAAKRLWLRCLDIGVGS